MSIAEAFFQTFPAPSWWRDLDASQRILCGALVISTAAHAGFLAVRFVPNEAFRMRPLDARLDVILVNAKHLAAPVKAEALAQANLDGGGDAAKGRAKSCLPTTVPLERPQIYEAYFPIPFSAKVSVWECGIHNL